MMTWSVVHYWMMTRVGSSVCQGVCSWGSDAGIVAILMVACLYVVQWNRSAGH